MDNKYVTTNGIKLHVIQDGLIDESLVILLHGFPEFYYVWKAQIPYLVSKGYWVWVPDQQGYNLNDKPDGIAAYNLDELAIDVIDAAVKSRLL